MTTTILMMLMMMFTMMPMLIMVSNSDNESGNADVAMMPTTKKSVIDANDHNDGDNDYYDGDNDDTLMAMTVTIKKKGKKS